MAKERLPPGTAAARWRAANSHSLMGEIFLALMVSPSRMCANGGDRHEGRPEMGCLFASG